MHRGIAAIGPAESRYEVTVRVTHEYVEDDALTSYIVYADAPSLPSPDLPV